MSAKWQLGGVNIYVTDEEIGGNEIKRAELFILDAQVSTFQDFGAGSEHRTIKGMVIGEADKNTLITNAKASTAMTFITPWSTLSNIKIHGVPKFSPKQYGGATIDGISYVANETALYECDLELIQT